MPNIILSLCSGVRCSIFISAQFCGGGSDPNRFAGYDTSILASEDDAPKDDHAENAVNPAARRLASYTGHAIVAADIPRANDDGIPAKKSQRIIDREDDYRRRRLERIISPKRHDVFAAGEATPDPSVRTYALHGALHGAEEAAGHGAGRRRGGR